MLKSNFTFLSQSHQLFVQLYSQSKIENPETLLLLHGSIQAGDSTWSSLIPFFETTGCNLVIPDLPGCGKTKSLFDQEPAFSLESVVEMLIAMMDNLNIESFKVLAYSYGAAIAMHLSAQYQSRVITQLLIEPPFLHVSPCDRESLLGNLEEVEHLLIAGEIRQALILFMRISSPSTRISPFLGAETLGNTQGFQCCIHALIDYMRSHDIDQLIADQPESNLCICEHSGLSLKQYASSIIEGNSQWSLNRVEADHLFLFTRPEVLLEPISHWLGEKHRLDFCSK